MRISIEKTPLLDSIPDSTLHNADRVGHDTVVRLILAVQGTAPVQNRPGRRGFTPVNVACASAVNDVFQTLLTAGANTQTANQVGE